MVVLKKNLFRQKIHIIKDAFKLKNNGGERVNAKTHGNGFS